MEPCLKKESGRRAPTCDEIRSTSSSSKRERDPTALKVPSNKRKKNLTTIDKFLLGYLHIKEKRLQFELSLETKRLEMERMRLRSEQEHETGVLPMLVALVQPQQQSLVGSLYIGNQSQNWTPTVQRPLSETNANVLYDILSNLTFN